MDAHKKHQRDNYVDRWKRLTKDMVIPNERKQPTPENLRWFLRSGHIRNMNHKNYYFVTEIAR